MLAASESSSRAGLSLEPAPACPPASAIPPAQLFPHLGVMAARALWACGCSRSKPLWEPVAVRPASGLCPFLPDWLFGSGGACAAARPRPGALTCREGPCRNRLPRQPHRPRAWPSSHRGRTPPPALLPCWRAQPKPAPAFATMFKGLSKVSQGKGSPKGSPAKGSPKSSPSKHSR